ncbi:MAG: hypothetical protein WA160_05945 [Pseudobdellovibrio sp.]
MKKSVWFFSLILAVAVVLVEFDVARRNSKVIAKNNLKKNEQLIPVNSEIKVAEKKNDRLSEVAESNIAIGDQRTQAIEHIASLQTVESLKQLEDIVLKEPDSTEASAEFETVLKVQAIEGIAAYPQKDLAISSLISIDPKINEAFLKDRIKRSLIELRAQSENSEKQVEDSLKKLIE